LRFGGFLLRKGKTPSEFEAVEQYTEQETARRRDAAMRKAMNTPPKAQDEMKIGRKPKTKPAKSPAKPRVSNRG
jgi:hypothetical protein